MEAVASNQVRGDGGLPWDSITGDGERRVGTRAGGVGGRLDKTC